MTPLSHYNLKQLMEPRKIEQVASLDGSQGPCLKWTLWHSKWLTGSHFKFLHKISYVLINISQRLLQLEYSYLVSVYYYYRQLTQVS